MQEHLIAPDKDELLGITLGGLIERYYDLIAKLSRELNIYTHELRYDSTAAKVFYAARLDDNIFDMYRNEHRAYKEFIVALVALHKQKLTDEGRHLVSMDALDETLYTEEDTLSLIRNIEYAGIPMDFVSIVDSAYGDIPLEKRAERGVSLSVLDAQIVEGLVETDE
ncbi:hypothetical protein D3C86_1702280 [compost metagenome]